MDTERILDEYDERMGWDVHSKLALALEYIENQQSNDAWKDFLEREAEDEEASGGLF